MCKRKLRRGVPSLLKNGARRAITFTSTDAQSRVAPLRIRGSSDADNRAWRTAQDRIGILLKTASQSGPVVPPDDNEISLKFRRGTGEYFGRIAGANPDVPGGNRALHSQPSQQLLDFSLRLLVQIFGKFFLQTQGEERPRVCSRMRDPEARL